MANQYNENSIQILESQEAVRTRPAMYIGDTGKKGLHHPDNLQILTASENRKKRDKIL